MCKWPICWMPQRLRRPAWHPYIDKTHLISLTRLLLSFFFCLATSTSHRQARSCSLSCSMSLILTALPLKIKKITPRITNSSVTHYTNGFRGIIKVYEINVWKGLNEIQYKSQFLITYREVKNCQVIDTSNCTGITRMDVDHAILIMGVTIFQLVKLHEHF